MGSAAGEFLRRVLPEKEKAGVSDHSSSGLEELHVLAVDDSHVDRKVIERLLKISSCKGVLILDFRGLGSFEIWVFFFSFFFSESMGTEFSVTAVESGTRALQFLGLDGEESSVGFDVRRMSSEIRGNPCLVAKNRKSVKFLV